MAFSAKNITIKEGNLLEATEEYIVQQNCCTAIRAQGLSAAIAAKWPECNPYSSRKPFAPRLNWAAERDRDIPGTIRVLGGKVICAFAQYKHGSGKDPSSIVYPDDKESRCVYFQQCLEKIAEIAPKSLAFPYGIGCGLAGGNWTVYSAMIDAFAQKYPQISIVIYKL